MSRIGKLPISIPSGVTITVDSDVITVKGPKGELTVPHLSDVTVSIEDGNAIVARKDDERIAKAQHGLQRALLNNAVVGVTEGFEKRLEVKGVGFRVATVPEPSSLIVAALSLIGLAVWGWRRKR